MKIKDHFRNSTKNNSPEDINFKLRDSYMSE